MVHMYRKSAITHPLTDTTLLVVSRGTYSQESSSNNAIESDIYL